MLKYYYYSTYKFNERTYPHFTIQFSDEKILRHTFGEPIINMWTLNLDLILQYFCSFVFHVKSKFHQNIVSLFLKLLVALLNVSPSAMDNSNYCLRLLVETHWTRTFLA